jgi:hypothetical protein
MEDTIYDHYIAIHWSIRNMGPCSPKTGPLDMLESPENEKEDSDERYQVQSREDRWYFKGGGL